MSLAEFNRKPEAVIIHNPVEAGSFKLMEGINDPAVLEDELLFRSRPDINLYSLQHRQFSKLLCSHFNKVFYLKKLAGDHKQFLEGSVNPNQVFTRDSLITIPWVPDVYIKARMLKPLRRPESDLMEAAVKKLGLREIIKVPENLILEGGDVIPFSRNGKRTLLIGYGPRTCFEAIEFLCGVIIPEYADEIVAVELAPWRMNLDGGFVPIAEDVILSETASIIGSTLFNGIRKKEFDIFMMAREMEMRIIEVTREESIYSQACNCVCLGDRKIIYYDLCPRVHKEIIKHSVEVYLTPGSELVKGRGGPRCMTRPVYKTIPYLH